MIFRKEFQMIDSEDAKMKAFKSTQNRHANIIGKLVTSVKSIIKNTELTHQKIDELQDSLEGVVSNCSNRERTGVYNDKLRSLLFLVILTVGGFVATRSIIHQNDDNERDAKVSAEVKALDAKIDNAIIYIERTLRIMER